MKGLLGDPHRRHLALTILVGAGLVAYLTGSLREFQGWGFALLLTLVGGIPIFYEAVAALGKRRLSANLAVSLAAIAALAIEQYAVAAEVVFIMLIGETLEHWAVGRTRAGIAGLLELRPDEARVRRAGSDHDHIVPVAEIRPDDVVIVRPGDRIPVDGRVIAGDSSVDQSPITGESVPADKTVGDEVFAGTINLYGALELSVEHVGAYTALEQIIHLVEHAEQAKAPSVRLADRYAAWFVPIVLLAAGVVYLVTRDVVRSVAVLVVACPCALVLATPTAVAAGIGSLVRRGVLVKGGVVLERLGRLGAVIFDKTGTLTLARMRVDEIVPAPGYSAIDVLRCGAAVESRSEHPIGKLIAEKAVDDAVDVPDTTDFVAHPGLGAEAKADGVAVRVGSPRFLREAGVATPDALAARLDELAGAGSTVVLVARGEKTIGAVAVRDTIRPEAREAIDRLRAIGITRIAMLTGDTDATARSVAETLGIDDVRSALLPAAKVDAVRAIEQDGTRTAMVGDGINDAPSLVTADVGVAMADIGTDVAIESADVILVGDDLRKLADGIDCGRRMLATIRQNILFFALLFNALAVAAASLGWVSPVAAAILHQVSSLTVVLNSLRLLIDGRRWRRRASRAVARLRRHPRLATAGVAAALLIAYALSGVHVVRVGEVGVVQHLGRFVAPIETPGLHYRMPWPLGRHRTLRPDAVRRVEIGFRTVSGSSAEPPAYEWNVQHRGGRIEHQAEEASVLTGDENLADVHLVTHYRVGDPLAALFTAGGSSNDVAVTWNDLVRSLAESSLRAEAAARPVDALLGSDRTPIETAIRTRVAAALERCGSGLVVDAIRLGDVHPPLAVVSSFRDVASAQEEKDASINDAEAYQYETKALAEGRSDAIRLTANGFAIDRKLRAGGAAERFSATAAAYAAGREVTRLRLWLETAEAALAGRRLFIIDGSTAERGRRRLFLRSGAGRVELPAPLPPFEDDGNNKIESTGGVDALRSDETDSHP